MAADHEVFLGMQHLPLKREGRSENGHCVTGSIIRISCQHYSIPIARYPLVREAAMSDLSLSCAT